MLPTKGRASQLVTVHGTESFHQLVDERFVQDAQHVLVVPIPGLGCVPSHVPTIHDTNAGTVEHCSIVRSLVCLCIGHVVDEVDRNVRMSFLKLLEVARQTLLVHKGKVVHPSEVDKGVCGVQEGKNGPEGLDQGPSEGIHPVFLATSARPAQLRNRMQIKRRQGGIVLVEADPVIKVLEVHQV